MTRFGQTEGGNRRRNRLSWFRLLCALAVLGLPLSDAMAAGGPGTEYQVKAAFLLNFVKFIEWPSTAFAEADSPIAICVLGDDPFGSSLDETAEGQTVNGRTVVVRRIAGVPAPRTCQVVFVRMPEDDVSRVLTGLGTGVLTVSEGDRFIPDGGMIDFVVENRRVRFDINLGAAGKAGLKMSARLLTVARSVAR